MSVWWSFYTCNIENEEWRNCPIEPFTDYRISSFGRVKNPKGNFLKPCPKGQGKYLIVTLCNKGTQKQIGVHQLVALTFVENPKPYLYDRVNHKDLDKWNDVATNLEWTDNSGNRQHYIKNREAKT